MLDLTDRIELASGSFVNLRDPNPDDIVLSDVAHGLSHVCRFSGQSSCFYSVAEHTLLVSDRLRQEGSDHRVQLAGLHHDDSESMITDIPRPAKAMLPDYRLLEKRVQRCILEALGLEDLPVNGSAVHEADQWALAQEAGELMPSTGRYWQLGWDWDGQERNLGAEPPERVRTRWLRRHRYLVERMGLG